MNFQVTGLQPQTFSINYKVSYDDGLYSNYNSGNDLLPIQKSNIVQIILVTCNTPSMADDVQWAEDYYITEKD